MPACVCACACQTEREIEREVHGGKKKNKRLKMTLSEIVKSNEDKCAGRRKADSQREEQIGR